MTPKAGNDDADRRLRPRRHRPLGCISLCLLILYLVDVSRAAAAAATDDSVREEDMALFDAVKADDVDAIDEALKNGADINARSPRGQQTPLMQSLLNGKEGVFKKLLEFGADVTIGERNGYTPMHGAGFQGRVDMARILHERGVDIRHVHEDGFEPAVRACWGPAERHTETVAFFLESGVPIGDIYDPCMERTQNEGTKELLQRWKARGEGGAKEEL